MTLSEKIIMEEQNLQLLQEVESPQSVRIGQG